MRRNNVLLVTITTLCFSSATILPAAAAGSDRASLQALLPTEKGGGGWRIASELDYYEAHNLWEYINGQAELYLQYGFKMVGTVDYEFGGGGALAVEIYEMESPLHAFGIYAAERSPDENFIDVGVQGYLSSNVLNFWDGHYYIKLTCFQESEANARVLQELAAAVDGRIKGEYAEPELFGVFPQANKITASERFIPTNFLGQTYLSNGYRLDYRADEKEYQIFIVDAGSAEKAWAAFNSYQDFLISGGEKLSSGTVAGFPMVTGSDCAFFLCNSYVGGILGADAADSRRLTEEIVGNVKGR